MVSVKQREANQKNALKSTGPISQEGKVVAAKNALRHGLLSKDLIVRDEEEACLTDLRNSLFASLQPQGVLEELLLEKIIGYAWRLRRVISAEKESLSERDYMAGLRSIQDCIGGQQRQLMNRYEVSLEKQLYKALHELQRLQGVRIGLSTTSLPVAIDINVSEIS